MIEEVPEPVKKLLDFKLKLQKEEFALELDSLDGKLSEPQKRRFVQVRQMISETNTHLLKLGWRNKKNHVDDKLGVLLRMKDMVQECFGIEKAKEFEKEAERRHLSKTGMEECEPFNFLTTKEIKAIESFKKSEEILNNYNEILSSVRSLKNYLEQKIRTESDYEKRIIYTEIFKMV